MTAQLFKLLGLESVAVLAWTFPTGAPDVLSLSTYTSHPLTYTCVLHKVDLYVVIRAASAHNGHPGHLQSW